MHAGSCESFGKRKNTQAAGEAYMAVNMVTLPEPESGTKRPKLTTPKYGAFAMVLSAEQYKLWLL